MTDEKWQEIKEKISKNFKVLEQHSQTKNLEYLGKKVGEEVIETIIFESPQGKIKLIRITRPLVLNKKFHYTRCKDGAQIQYIYSQDEKTHRLEVYKWDQTLSEWQKFELPKEF